MKHESRYWGMAALSASVLVAACASPVEPTEEEMRASVEQDLSSRGNASGRANELRVDGPFSGMTVGLVDFAKIACVSAQGEPGFICDYRMGVRMDYHSNTPSADAHSQAANQLLQWMTGNQPVAQNLTSRFVKTQGRWIRMQED